MTHHTSASDDAMASFGAMRGAFNGLDVAMQGGAESAMGATQAIMSLGRAFAASNPIFAAMKRGQSIQAASQIACVDSEEVQAVRRAGSDRRVSARSDRLRPVRCQSRH